MAVVLHGYQGLEFTGLQVPWSVLVLRNLAKDGRGITQNALVELSLPSEQTKGNRSAALPCYPQEPCASSHQRSTLYDSTLRIK